jgi:hypothetical protein
LSHKAAVNAYQATGVSCPIEATMNVLEMIRQKTIKQHNLDEAKKVLCYRGVDYKPMKPT